VPFAERLAGVFIESVIHAFYHLHIAHRTIASYDGGKHNCTVNIVPHEVRGISGIYLMFHFRRHKITLGRIFQFGEMKNPTPAA